MIFLNVYSFDQDKTDEIIKRRLEKGRMFPKGIKVLGEWSGIGGNKGVIVVEVDDPKLLYQAVLAWSAGFQKYSPPIFKSIHPPPPGNRKKVFITSSSSLSRATAGGDGFVRGRSGGASESRFHPWSV